MFVYKLNQQNCYFLEFMGMLNDSPIFAVGTARILRHKCIDEHDTHTDLKHVGHLSTNSLLQFGISHWNLSFVSAGVVVVVVVGVCFDKSDCKETIDFVGGVSCMRVVGAIVLVPSVSMLIIPSSALALEPSKKEV